MIISQNGQVINVNKYYETEFISLIIYMSTFVWDANMLSVLNFID